MDRINELLRQMQEKYDAASKAETIEERTALMDEFDAMKAEKESLERMVEAEKSLVAKKALGGISRDDGETAYEKAVRDFANAARRGFRQAMNEGTASAGGYTVPEDISTRIEQLRVAKFGLESLVGKENVSTESGARTYRKRSTQVGFVSVGEGGKIPQKATPEYDRYTYTITKYAGYYVATNELLADSDANIVNEIMSWIADDGRITRNKLVLAAMDEKYTRSTSPETAKTITNIDSIKSIVNVDLGQAFGPTSRIITNDSGLDWLDHQKVDGATGDYVLKRHNNDPLDRVVSAGSLLIPVTVIPNADLPNETTSGTPSVTKFPFYIGDLKEGVRLFDRKRLSVMASDVASTTAVNAFEEDLTLFRAIERLDCVLRDEMAFYKGFVTPSAG